MSRRVGYNLNRQTTQLTELERKLKDLFCSGLTLPEAARKLKINPGTARGMMNRIYTKLGCFNKAELIAMASEAL
jgi:DNA-binding CsgD family transcriptional regulator